MLTRGRICDKVSQKEGERLIVYMDVLQRLAARGWTSYKLRHEGVIAEGTLTRLRKGQSVTTDTIDKLCELLECQPGEILRWEPGE